MCLAAWSVGQSARFPWVIASNRDEFFARPSAPMAWWQPRPAGPAVLGGRDLSAGGTWLGLTAAGRFAFVTNVRAPGPQQDGLPSRGALVLQALASPALDAGTLAALARVPRNGFNLVVGDLRDARFAWASNQPAQQRVHAAGLHGLSNAALDTPWPKVVALKRRLGEAVAGSADADGVVAAAFDALSDRRTAPDAQLPATGVPLARERALSAAFIRIADGAAAQAVYGTRCATVVVVEQQPSGRVVRVVERRFDAEAGRACGESAFAFALE